MPRANYRSKRVLNFGGPSKNALDAENIRYFYVETGSDGIPYCKVRTRQGHAVAFNPASAVKSMHNFTSIDPVDSSALNWLLYYTGSEVKIYDIDGATSFSMDPAASIGSPTVKLSMAEAGTRAYFCGHDANGIGTGSGYVVDNNGDDDKLFEPPMLTTAVTITPTEPATPAGVVTAGTHKLLFILTTRNGFTGQPSPVNTSGVAVPASITSTGSKTINFAFSGTFPAAAELGSIAVLMTTTDDTETFYFVGGSTAGVVAGAWSGNITVDISDAALLNSPPAIDYFSKLTRDPVTNAAPFNPSFLCVYKNRMVYGAGDRLYISDPFDYQSVTEDFHVQYLPGRQTITGAFPYRDGTLHLTSHEATFSLSDSGGVPVDWSGPQLVDGRIGTPAPHGTTQDSSRNYAWVATPESLRLFSDGTYLDPVTDWIPAWGRINWTQPGKIEIEEDIEEQTVMVLAPLDEATDPSHLLVFDYKAGKSSDRIRFSLNDAPGRFCMARVINPDTGRNEFWFGPTVSGKVWAQDKTEVLDETAAITGQVYETARLLDAAEITGLNTFHGARLTTRGTAALSVVPYSEDHTKSINEPKLILLSQLTAGERPLRQWRMNANNQSIKFTTESGWFELTEMEVFHSPWVGQR